LKSSGPPSRAARPRRRIVYTGIALAAILVVALGSLQVVEADDSAPSAPHRGGSTPPHLPRPPAPKPGAPAVQYRVQLNGPAPDSEEAAGEIARTLTFEHGVTDVVDINGKRTVLVGAPPGPP
jgi:hypothetical protein